MLLSSSRLAGKGVQRLYGSSSHLLRHVPRFTPFASVSARAQTCRASATTVAPLAARQEQQDQPQQPLSFKAHIDFKFVKDNVEMLTQNCQVRKAAADPALVAQLYDEFLRLKQETDAVRAARNDNSAAMKAKLDAEARGALVAKGQALKEQLAALEQQLVAAEEALQAAAQKLPNLTHPAVPLGGEELAAVVRTVGRQREFGFQPKDHVTIAEALDLVDFEAGAEVSGSKFYYLRNAAALLELALVNWAMGRALAAGFTPLMTPDLVKEAVLEKCGFQPRANNTQVYSVAGSNLCLTGTAEVPLAGVYMDRVVEEGALPIKMAAFGHCFRTEAGAAGAAGKGLYRVHQFSKVELFVLSTPEQSEALHQQLIDFEASMFEELGLHFKVLDMSSEDLGAPAYRKFDVEAWMPGLARYGEISSASNCTDYQSRRLNIRYRPAHKGEQQEQQQQQQGGKKKKGSKSGGKTEFVHTLNATACAVPRMIVAILENYQQEDGSVVVPQVLRPYMGGMEVIRPPASK